MGFSLLWQTRATANGCCLPTEVRNKKFNAALSFFLNVNTSFPHVSLSDPSEVKHIQMPGLFQFVLYPFQERNWHKSFTGRRLADSFLPLGFLTWYQQSLSHRGQLQGPSEQTQGSQRVWDLSPPLTCKSRQRQAGKREQGSRREEERKSNGAEYLVAKKLLCK